MPRTDVRTQELSGTWKNGASARTLETNFYCGVLRRF